MTTAIASHFDVDEMDGLRTRLGLTNAELATIIGVDQATAYRWRQGDSSPRAVYRSQLAQLLEMQHLMQRVFAGPDLARAWLRTSLPESLGGTVTPMDVLLQHRIDRVVNTLQFIARGA
jgi:transcriptional regulator with XRE-family HTH domain